MNNRTTDTESVELVPVVTQEDLNRVAVLGVRIWHEHYDTIIGKAQVDYMTAKFQSAEAIQEQIAQEEYHYYLLVERNGPVGYFAFRILEGLFLSKIYVAAEGRGKGYSRTVMDFLKKLCDEQQLGRIWLTVNKNNSSSIAVYEKLGFICIRTQVTDIGNGFVMDDYVMELNLSP